MLIDVTHTRLLVLRQCRLITGVLKDAGVRISMDGVRRAYDNIFVERLSRSLKYKEVYPHDYATPLQARRGIGHCFAFYDHRSPHQALAYRAPAEACGIMNWTASGNGSASDKAATAAVPGAFLRNGSDGTPGKSTLTPARMRPADGEHLSGA